MRGQKKNTAVLSESTEFRTADPKTSDSPVGVMHIGTAALQLPAA